MNNLNKITRPMKIKDSIQTVSKPESSRHPRPNSRLSQKQKILQNINLRKGFGKM